MNFSPNAGLYKTIIQELDEVQSECDNIKSTNFDIKTEEDISSEIDSIQKNVTKSAEKAIQGVQSLKNNFNEFMSDSLQQAQEAYIELAETFYENEMYELFQSKFDYFPYNEWFEVPDLEIRFSEINNIFKSLSTSNTQELDIYFKNLNAFTKAHIASTPSLSASYFKSTLEIVDKKNSTYRDKFINDLFEKNNDFTNTFMVLLLTDKLDKKYFDYNQWLPQLEKSWTEQCSTLEGQDKLVDFLLDNQVNNYIFYSKNSRGRYSKVSHIYWDTLKKIIELDTKLNLNITSKISKWAVEIVSKVLTDSKNQAKCQEFISYAMTHKLENTLSHKDDNKNRVKI